MQESEYQSLDARSLELLKAAGYRFALLGPLQIDPATLLADPDSYSDFVAGEAIPFRDIPENDLPGWIYVEFSRLYGMDEFIDNGVDWFFFKKSFLTC